MDTALDNVKFDEKGLVPAIAQDVTTGAVVMQAYMNKEALGATLATGYAHYFSRSRNCLWKKGETSGHLQEVAGVYYDCDGDSILLRIRQHGAACHTGNYSCFYRALKEEEHTADCSILQRVYDVVSSRKAQPKEGSYTNYLFDKGLDKICKKVGEEATETVIAAKNKNRTELTNEISDLLYHLTVLLVNEDVTLNEVCAVLEEREGLPPLAKYAKK